VPPDTVRQGTSRRRLGPFVPPICADDFGAASYISPPP